MKINGSGVYVWGAFICFLAIYANNLRGQQNERIEYSVSERGPHHRKWERVTESLRTDGTIAYQTNSYVELATGMHYLDEGKWEETQELIEPVPEGAEARRGPHKVRFASQINSAGAITLIAPDGKVFRSHPLALYYMDATDSRYEMIAQLKDSTATLVADNELVYPDAFTSFKADIRFRYTRNGLEQDIILRQSPPSPELFGMRPETARICVITEFIEAPTPERRTHVLRRLPEADGPPLAEPELYEETLDFGAIKAYQGSAFPLGDESGPEPTAATGKTWEEWEGRTVLVERTDYQQVKEFVERLPKSAALLPERKDGALQAWASRGVQVPRVFPAAPDLLIFTSAAPALRLALSDFKEPGFVLDYQMVITTSNFTFRGDTTYYVSNNVTLSGSTILEGGAVIKFSSNGIGNNLTISGTLDCQTSPFHPAYFTGRDDDSVGETISGSTGNPGLGFYASRALNLTAASGNYTLLNLRFRNASKAIYLNSGGITATLHGGQFERCSTVVNYNANSVAILRNVLAYDSATVFGGASPATNIAENMTFHRVSTLTGVSSTYLTNCLIISVTNGLLYSGANNAYNISDSGIFQTVGPATHYLASGSTNRDAGTANINPTLLAELAKRTTYPPVVLSNHFTFSTNLSIQPARDSDTPDRGYHYDVLDYVASGISVTNATVTLAQGVVLGIYGGSGSHGLRLEDGAALTATGSPLNPCRIVRYNTVQEQANTNWAASSAGSAIADAAWGGSPRPVAQFKFTEWTAPAGGAEHFTGDYNTGPDTAWISFVHSQFRGGAIGSLAANMAFTNCLFQRVSVADYSTYSDYHNCTIFGGTLDIDGGYGGHRAFNNVLDQTAITANYVTNDFNGYGTNQSRIWSGGANDVILSTTNVAFETGPLGRFYVPTNGTLVNTGSMTAVSAGLYHFTTATNQTKEAATIVDLGFHYLALTNGVPPDYDYDGIADYAEDTNGNGEGDIGETLWLHSDTDYDGRSDGDEPADGTDSLNASSVKLVRLGHWRFDDGNLTGDEGQLPDSSISLNIFPPVTSWGSNALYMQSTSRIRYREIETNGRPNINLRNGTVRFWFKPDWGSSSVGGTGPQTYARFIELGRYDGAGMSGWWALALDLTGNTLSFTTHSNGVICPLWAAPITFHAGRWHQIALSYSPSNSALYLNGQLVYNDAIPRGNDRPLIAATGEKLNTSGGGIYNYPDAAMRANGIRIGNDFGNVQQAKGQFEELETFNYPLTAQQIAAGFPGFYGASSVTNDFDYDGRSDILEHQADGNATNDASAVMGGRLGYWRFNGATNNLLGEALQSPLVLSGVSVAPGWSSNALVIPDGSTARVVYRDVETNGWANFNARSGAVRFWFRPNWSWDGTGSDGSFLFLGHPTSETTGRWDFGIKGPGKKVWLRTATNGTSTTLFETSVNFISNHWCQIALNYGSSSVALYVNGTLITNHATGITQWPSLADRANGLVIGNNHAGTRPVNGQFDEVETFNRQLTDAEIWRSFESFRAMDNDLNGTPDSLEDVSLSASAPFPGFPVAVTGVIEAEQFDKGGKGIAYTNVANNFWTNDYRASQIEVTNANDLGMGYCVNNLRAGDWLNYTLDVRVGQTYAIEPRVGAVGTNVGGVFRFDFYTNGVKYTNTGPLTITSTNWADLTYRMVRLAPGTNIMRLVALTNAPGASGVVGRFNYISVYPAWNEWWPTDGMQTNWVTSLMVTNSTTNIWREATNNAYRIQTAIDSLTGPGVVRIPSGSYYVAQKVVDENTTAQANTAVYISKNNVAIQGEGPTNTVLIGHNRATIPFYLGYVGTPSGPLPNQTTNAVFSQLGIEGRPHLVAVTNSSTASPKELYTNRWETGFFYPHDGSGGNPGSLGCLVVSSGKSTTENNYGLIATNCLFRNPPNNAIRLQAWTTNVLVRSCTFLIRDGTNGVFPYPRSTIVPLLTTSNSAVGTIGVSATASLLRNLVIIDNVYNGSSGMTAVNTNGEIDAGDGIVYLQGGGNWFIARNTITNYGLEGVQFSAGPGAGVANDFGTLVSSPSTTAYVAGWTGWDGASGLTSVNFDHSFSLVANRIYGGRFGQLGGNHFNTGVTPQRVHFNGNSVEVHPPINSESGWSWDYPGAAVTGEWSEFLNVSGNLLVTGGHGVRWQDNGTNAFILKNDFSNANYRALSVTSTNADLLSIIAAKNLLNQGSGSHVRMRIEDSPGWYLLRNSYRANGLTNTLNPFITPSGSSAHLVH